MNVPFWSTKGKWVRGGKKKMKIECVLFVPLSNRGKKEKEEGGREGIRE